MPNPDIQIVKLDDDDKRMSLKVFTLNIARAVRAERIVKGVIVRADMGEMDVVFIDGVAQETGTLHTDNFYTSYQQRGDFQAEVDLFLNTLRHLGTDELVTAKTFDQIADRIYPKLENKARIIRSDEMSPNDKSKRLWRDWLGATVICYVFDTPHTLAFLSSYIPTKFEITLDEIHERAMQNLIRRTEATEWEVEQYDGGPRMLEIDHGDTFSATRVLCGATIRQKFGSVRGILKAILPSRDRLLVVELVRQNDLKLARQLAGAAYTAEQKHYEITMHAVTVPKDNSGIMPI